MDIKQRIKKFDTENKPFYMVDHENGTYSLCLPLSSLKGEYIDFCQEAFNCYALQAGDPVTDGRFYTHGSGHEWKIVFEKAFENEEKLQQITFDCEATGFFCYSEAFDVIEEYGRRFRKICMNEQEFTELVCKALSEDKKIEEETATDLTPFLTEVAAWAKHRGFEVEQAKTVIQIYSKGKFVAMVDESGMMGYHPFDEAFELLDELKKIRNRIPKEDMNQGMQMNM